MTRSTGIAAVLCIGMAVGACDSSRATSTSSPDLGNVQKSVTAFMLACVSTTRAPSGASERFTELGFSGGPEDFTSSYAKANISSNGQCNLTPKSGNFSSVVTELSRQMANSNVEARKLGGEEAWLFSNGAVVLISRSGGGMSRTAPGVFKG
jgi:hypothetical protein